MIPPAARRPVPYSVALPALATVVAAPFARVMEARNGVLAKTAFDVAAVLQRQADKLHTTTETLRTCRDAKKRLNPTSSELSEPTDN